VGISSGANFLGALMVQSVLGRDAVVATVFSDDNKKYLSTDLMKTEPVKPGFLAPDVDLIGFRGFKRTCETCCVPSECEPDVRPLERLTLPPCPRRTPGC
jgi:cysteine synthase A